MIDQLPSNFLWDCAWQSTFILVIGGLLSRIWAHWPARAHRITFLALVACMATPLMSQVVRHYGWGILPQPVAIQGSSLEGNARLEENTLLAPSLASETGTSHRVANASLSGPVVQSDAASTAVTSENAKGPVSWARLFVYLWIVLSGLVLARVLVSMAKEISVLRGARPLTDERILGAVDKAIERLGLRSAPSVFLSDRVECPVICCWGLRPAMLLPRSISRITTTDDLTGLICHELAHWKRRDYLAALFAESVACFLPWQPLVWWAKRRLDQFSELACDNWVLACGQPAESYAETLLTMLPQRKPVFAIAAVNHRKKLENRIRHILDGKRSDPRPGRRWACAATLVMAFAIAAIAAGQTRPAAAAQVESTKSAEASPTMALRLLKKGHGSDFSSLPSSDGRFETDVDWTTGNLVVRELPSGETRQLTDDASLQVGNFAMFSIISPDSTKVAYGLYVANSQELQLRVIGIDGSGKRVLYSGGNRTWAYPQQWSPDGKLILAMLETNDGNENQIALVSAADGLTQVLKSLGDRAASALFFSPDGTRLAYDLPKKKESQDYDVFSISTDGKEETPLLQTPAKEKLLGWSPDRKWFLYASDRLGSMDAYAIAFADGKPQGLPKLINKDIGDIMPKGFLADGSFYYKKEYKFGDIYMAKLDFSTGKFVSPPTQISKGAAGDYAWSTDWSCLAYIDRHTEPTTLCLWSTDTGELRELTLPSGYFAALSWSPDAKKLLSYWSGTGLSMIDVETGGVTVIVEDPPSGYQIGGGTWLPSGKSILLRRGEPGRIWFVIRDLETGKEKEIFSDPNLTWDWSLSPDGKWLAFTVEDPETKASVLKVLAVPEGGEAREIPREPGAGEFTWAPDSKALLYLVDKSLWRVSVEGGQSEKLCDLERPDLFEILFRIHPDGQRIAFWSGTGYTHEVWVIENFLPKE